MKNGLIHILGFLGTAGALIVTQIFTKKRTDAEAQNLVSKTYGEVLDALRQEVLRLTAKIHDLEKREIQLFERVHELENELTFFKKGRKLKAS